MTNIKIPTHFMGVPVNSATLERVLKGTASAPKVPNTSPSSPISLGTANINPRDYIQVGINGLSGKPVVISAYELPGSNNQNYVETHNFLLDKGLYMPTPLIFMNYFKKVVDAQQNKGSLNYADGSSVPNSEVEELFKHFTVNYKNQFGRNDVGVWTWLNAQFKNGNLETVTGKNSQGLVVNTSTLDSCLGEDCLVTLDINGQGLSTKKSRKSDYEAGKNIYFWHPREGQVALFNADSSRADLNCDSSPDDRYAGLGVFGCTEGASVAKN